MAMGISLVLGALTGCAGTRAASFQNPSFRLSEQRAVQELAAMEAHSRPLERPVIVLGGYGDMGNWAARAASTLRKTTTTPERVSSIAFFFTPDFETARRRVHGHVESMHAAIGQRHDELEVDLVGVSMGGLIARYAAATVDGHPGLTVRRMYTIGTPHRGTPAAEFWSPDAKVRAMRPGSDLLRLLDADLEEASYELVCYVRLRDGIVGEVNASPEGVTPWWLPTPGMEFAHMNAQSDPRILADIARRLRGERPYTREPATPLPEEVLE
jgi:pimeloyl-ACP methyl ester carboxylesterase